jgi:uncharacterized protein
MMNAAAEIPGSKTKTQSIIILLYAPIVLTIFIYYGSSGFYNRHFSPASGPAAQYYYFLASFILLAIIPALIWRLGFGHKFSEMGLSLGNFKYTLIFTLIGLAVMAILAFLSSSDPAFQAEYPLFRGLLTNPANLGSYILMYGLYYIGWEFFFRGFMLFGLEKPFGKTFSILIQTIPSCLVHIGKPDAEIFSSIIAGLVFGWVAFRCRSIWPLFFSHWALGALLDVFIIYR